MARGLGPGEARVTSAEQDQIGLTVALLAQASATLDQIAAGAPSPYHTVRGSHRVRLQTILRLLDAIGTISRRTVGRAAPGERGRPLASPGTPGVWGPARPARLGPPE